MEFAWDETKRLSNIAKHGFDFAMPIDCFLRPKFVSRPGQKVTSCAHNEWIARYRSLYAASGHYQAHLSSEIA